MTKAGSARPAEPGTSAVRIALGAPDVCEGLSRHAAARLAVLLADRPRAVREDAARDVVQEASRRALAGEADFDPTKATVVAWVHGILEYVVYESCRALRKQPAQPCANPEAWDDLEARLSAHDGVPVLRTLLARLPEEHRRIVTMHHVDGTPHGEIAATLGISVGCSRVRLARAMTELKRLAAREDI